MKLIQLTPEHYVIADDSAIKEGDCVVNGNNRVFQYTNESISGLNYCKKITQTTPIGGLSEMLMAGVKEISLSEVEELINGYSLEKMAHEYAHKEYPPELYSVEVDMPHQGTAFRGFLDGFNAHKQLVNDKLFTVEDMEKHLIAILTSDNIWEAKSPTELSKKVKSSIQSLLPKTEWDVEFVDGKLKLI